ncbi:MAG: 50S ribosomal protein L30 [Clostridiales bacterium]|nr:50S ribosomal protein L30 [Clostridiales bacterium]MBR5975216.1 50S ribosomal protein L30 [Clostridiales bacterium]
MANLKITLVKSTNKSKKNQAATVKALGLKKIGQSVEKADNEAIRGMVRTVAHLVTCEEV